MTQLTLKPCAKKTSNGQLTGNHYPSMIKGSFATSLSNLSRDPLKSSVILLFATAGLVTILQRCCGEWSDFIPTIYYPAWRRFLSCFYNKTSSNPEKDAVLRDVLPLFHNSSIRVPFRFLSDSEVLQVSGLSRNFATISRLKHVLHSQTIRSFVGNSFHPKLISLAIGTPDHVRAWIQGETECFFGVASPDDVRQGYVSFRQAIENNLKMSGRSTQTAIVPEPYRHINFRSLVMSPVTRPPIAQPIVTQILPPYLTKEAIDNIIRIGESNVLTF